jgi:hypothetical protein
MAIRGILLIVNKGLRTQAIVIIYLLAVQYILGMAANMFVKFPETGTEGQMWTAAWSQLPSALHIILGLGLFIGAVVLAIRSARAKNQGWIRASGFGLLFIFLAVFGGSRFIPTQNDLYSFLMALSFLGAFISYSLGIYWDARK